MNEKVYIVIRNKPTVLVESAWSTRELATSATHYHAIDSRLPVDDYSVIEREINKAKLHE